MFQKRWASLPLLLVMLAPMPGFCQATISIPADSKFVVQVDLQAAKQTHLGNLLFKLIKEKAEEEISKEGAGGERGLAKIKEMLGLDPFEEIQGLTLSASDFQHPERSALAIVKLRKNSGNLEGLVLGLPNYQASEHRSHQLHSVKMDDHQIFGAMHGKDNQDRTLVLATSAQSIKQVLDHMDGQGSAGPEFRQIVLAQDNAPIAKLQLFEIPRENLGDGPQTNIAKILKSFLIEVRGAGENLTLHAKMSTDTEKQAEQLRQMAQGLIAMLDFARSMDSDEDLKAIQETIVGLQTTRDGTQVDVGLTVLSEKVEAAIREELK